MLGVLSFATPAVAQQTTAPPNPPVPSQQTAASVLSLDDAIRLAEARNEQVAIAEAGVQRAQADEVRARSQVLPQISGSGSYDRTLATEFATEFSTPALPQGCSAFAANPGAPLADRVTAIEQAIDCGTIASGLFSSLNSLPFGRQNIYRLNLQFSQTLYSGGRINAQRSLASSGRRLADISLTSARAQLVFDVTQAYFDAALSDRIAAIADAALKQAEATAAQVELGFKAGRQPEFELLRARVARDNQRPLVIRAQSQRALAYLRLAQLLNMPPGSDLRVAASLDDPVLPVPDRFAPSFTAATARKDEATVDDRAAVRQAAESVNARNASLAVARSERLPSVSFDSSYGRVAYPSSLPSFGDFLTNWTVGAFVQVPLFTGGRLRGDRMAAEADVAEARARLDQSRKLARLDAQTAYQDLSAADATWQASAGTVEQAARAYEIAELRYREGVSTQLELSDARLLLEQAGANRAQAARDLQVARARLALLPDLPLAAGALPSSLAGASSAAQGSSPAAASSAIPAPTTTGTSAPGAPAVSGQQGTRTTGTGIGGM
jgi:outer membrane protein TolC